MNAFHKLTVLVIALAILPASVMADVPEPANKPVTAVLEFYPNYTGHLLGVAQIGYNSSYAEMFQNTVEPDDLLFLQENAHLLEWSEGDEGLLSYFFLTFPAALNPGSKEELGNYLTDLNSVIVNRSFFAFEELYCDEINEFDLWTGFNRNNQIFEYSDEIQRISRILMDNYDQFKTDVWPLFESTIQATADNLNEIFLESDILTRWEEMTGLPFRSSAYSIVLSTGMENGLSGKALGYAKDWHFYGQSTDELLQSVCQETGLRVLANLCNDQYKKYNPKICFEVYESLSTYLSNSILNEIGFKEIAPNVNRNDSRLFSLFELLSQVNPDISVDQLYNTALDTYARSQVVVTALN